MSCDKARILPAFDLNANDEMGFVENYPLAVMLKVYDIAHLAVVEDFLSVSFFFRFHF